MTSSPLSTTQPEPVVVQRAAAAAEALAKAQRGAMFYEHSHPAAQQQRRELEQAVHAWHAATLGDTVVAAAATRLLVTGIEAGLDDELAVGLCSALLTRSVIGLRLCSPTSARDLDVLVRCLGESEKRLRAAGGISAVLQREGVASVQAFEIDVDDLSAGESIDETAFDPLVVDALRAVLVQEGDRQRRGKAVELRLDDVTSAQSLGSLLDELIDGAVPGVAEEQAAPIPGMEPSPIEGATAEELAELSCRAYAKVTTRASSPEDLTAAANVLSDAMSRLTPAARFKLLRRLAESADDAGADALGKAVPNPVLLSAIAQVVMGGSRDSPLASAIGTLLERLRPVEQERQQLLDELEGEARRSGRPLDGIFLEELKEKARREGFSALQLPFRETRDSLVMSARMRRSMPNQPPIIARTFASLRPEHRFLRSTRLLRAMLQHEANIAPATLESCRALLANSAQSPELADVGGELIEALWDRAILDGPESGAAAQLFDVIASRTGHDWCIQLLRRLGGRTGTDNAMLLTELVRRVVVAHESDQLTRRLVDALAQLDRTLVREVERRVVEMPPQAVTILIARAAREAVSAGLSLAQNALRAGAVEVKVAALRALAPLAEPAAINLLRRATGLDGEAAAIAALFAQRDDKSMLFELARAAVEALGASRSPLAVPTLRGLLLARAGTGVGPPDPMLAYIGRALAINNTSEARQVIDEGKRHKLRSVRVACGAEA